MVRSYAWGLDIARSMTDAGGVGALLQITDHASGKTYLPCYDGNGNIAALINAATGALAAVYEYSPFGEALRAETSDSTLVDQPFRFSTKYYDSETALYDYGHRYYDPHNGRFLGRDPSEEKGGVHLYRFCSNDAINRYDVLGNYDVEVAIQNALNNGLKPGTNAFRLFVEDDCANQDQDIDNNPDFGVVDAILQQLSGQYSLNQVDASTVLDATAANHAINVAGQNTATVLANSSGTTVVLLDAGGNVIGVASPTAPNSGPTIYEGGTLPAVNVNATVAKSSGGGILSTVGSFLGGVVKGAVGGFVGGVVLGAVAAVSAPVAVAIGGAALIYGAYKWADGGFQVTANGLGEVVGSALTGGLGARVGNFVASTALDGAIVQVGWKGGEITLTNPNKAPSVPGGTPTPDIRINPTGTWSGGADSLPHYHARPGIGNHRPWQGGP